MTRSKAIHAALITALVAVPAIATASADSDKATVAGIVHIRNSAPAFHGNVGAENETCEGPRTVKMFERKRNGDRKLLGTGMSDLKNGHWEIIVDPLSSGSYFATAPVWEFTDSLGEEWTCLRAKSRTLVVD